MRTSGEGPIDARLALPVVGGARSAHDERLVTRFPPAVWPFHPSIFDAPPSSHCDQQRPALALPLLVRLWCAFGRHLPAHLLIHLSEWHDGLARALAWVLTCPAQPVLNPSLRGLPTRNPRRPSGHTRTASGEISTDRKGKARPAGCSFGSHGFIRPARQTAVECFCAPSSSSTPA